MSKRLPMYDLDSTEADEFFTVDVSHERDVATRLKLAIDQARAQDITDDHMIRVPVGELDEILEELMSRRALQ